MQAPGLRPTRKIDTIPSLGSRRDFASVDTSRANEKARAPARKRRWWAVLIKWSIIGTLAGMVVALVGYWGLVFYFEHRLPDTFEPSEYVSRTTQVTRVFSGGGDVLAELGDEKRTVIADADIPKLVKQAVLSAEDADFYNHDGLDYWGMARAMWKNVRDQRFTQGASTITQQVAKTFFLSSERTMSRKLKEVVLARRIEQKLTKDEILYLYLNQIYWGHGRYGLYEASRFYFGKEPKALTVADVALLAGIIAAPERFSPFRDKQKAAERRAYVLDQMAAHTYITADEAEKAKREPLRLNLRGDPKLGSAGYAMDMVHRFLVEKFGAARLERGGLRVFTSIDSRLQEEAEQALQRGLRSVDRIYGFGPPSAAERLPRGRVQTTIEQLKKSLPPRGVRSGEVVLGVVVGMDKAGQAWLVDMGLGPCRLPFSSLGRYLGKLKPDEMFDVGDVLRVSPRFAIEGPALPGAHAPVVTLDVGPQGALVVLDPRSHEIKAIVGGYDHDTHPFNRAEQARRQAGSTFKPIVVGAALESGIVEPTMEFRNVPETYKMEKGKYWKPRNFSNTYDGRLYSVRLALAKSINVIAVKILEKTGVKRVADFARRIGVTSDLPQNLSLALGSAALSPLELTRAYATFANGGFVREPVLVTRVEDYDGTVLYEAREAPHLGTTPKVAYRITEMMESVIDIGTGQDARSLGRPAAGKTGTSDQGMDTWFVGYTPELVATVWIGFDDRRAIEKASGGKLAAPIWARFMTAALEGSPVSRFTAPKGVEPLPHLGADDARGREDTPDPEDVAPDATDPLEAPPSAAPEPSVETPATELLYE